MNDLERAFVSESRAVAEREATRARRTNRRLRALLAGVAVLLAAAVVGGVLALAQRGEARDAETAQLAQRLGAQALVEEDLDRALLLARQAVAIDDSPQTRSSLLAALLRAPKPCRSCTAPTTPSFWAAALSPDGSTLAVADFGRILFFDARTFEQVGDPLLVGSRALAYSPDGSTLALGGRRRLGPSPRRCAHAERLAQADSRERPRASPSRRTAALVVADRWVDELDPRSSMRPPCKPSAPDRAGGLPAALSQSYGRFPRRAHARRALARHRLRRRRARVVGSREPPQDAGAPDRRRAITRSRSAPTGGPSASASTGGSSSSTCARARPSARRGAASRRARSGASAPDGQTVVTASDDGTVTLWDADAVTPPRDAAGALERRLAPVFSRDGKTLYTVAPTARHRVGRQRNRRLGRPFRFTHDRRYRLAGHRTRGSSARTAG